MKKENLSTDDYEKLKTFMGLYFDWYMAKPHSKPENHPLRVIEISEKKSLSQAKRGLEMAINDCVEMSSDWTPEQVAEADARFVGRDTFTLSEVRRHYSRKYFQVLKRGRIQSVQEYYLVKGIADGGGIEAGAIERVQIESMLAQFEASVTRTS